MRNKVEIVTGAPASSQHVLQPRQILLQAETPGSHVLRVCYQQLLKGHQVSGLGIRGQGKYPGMWAGEVARPVRE